MRHRFHIAGRLTATLLVALWASQPVLVIAHAQEHAHRYCPEHQAFEEAAGSPGTGLGAQARELGTLERQQPASPSASLPLHEECAVFAPTTRDQMEGPEPLPIILACLAVSRPSTAPPQPPSSPLSVLDTAPKASPPARLAPRSEVLG
jgi:hypothetical protein